MAIKVKHLMHTIDDAFSIWFFHFSIFDKRASIIIIILIESIFLIFSKKKRQHTISSLLSLKNKLNHITYWICRKFVRLVFFCQGTRPSSSMTKTQWK